MDNELSSAECRVHNLFSVSKAADVVRYEEHNDRV